MPIYIALSNKSNFPVLFEELWKFLLWNGAKSSIRSFRLYRSKSRRHSWSALANDVICCAQNSALSRLEEWWLPPWEIKSMARIFGVNWKLRMTKQKNCRRRESSMSGEVPATLEMPTRAWDRSMAVIVFLSRFVQWLPYSVRCQYYTVPVH